jgi:hypothetical protein
MKSVNNPHAVTSKRTIDNHIVNGLLILVGSNKNIAQGRDIDRMVKRLFDPSKY